MMSHIKGFNEFQKKFISAAVSKKRLFLIAKPGKGKTLACLGLFSLLLKRGVCNKALVFTKPKGMEAYNKNNVVGLKILHIKTEEDITRLNHIDPVAYDMYLVSTSLVREHWRSFLNFSAKCDFLTIDEIHDYRNYKSPVYISLRTIAMRFYARSNTRTLGITASPVTKNITDLYAAFNLLVPGVLGSYQNFCSRYVIFEDRQFTARVNQRTSTGVSKGKKTIVHREIVGFKNLDNLYASVDPYIYEDGTTDFTPHVNIHYYDLEDSRDEYNKVIKGLGLDSLYRIEFLKGTVTHKFHKLNTEMVEVRGKGLVRPSELRIGDTLLIRENISTAEMYPVCAISKEEAIGEWSSRLVAAQRTMSTNPDKRRTLLTLIPEDRGALIFCQYRQTAKELETFLRSNFPTRKVQVLTGDTAGFEQKVKMLGKTDLAIITKVASQSVDFYFSRLINYEMVIQPGFMDQLYGRLTRDNSPYRDIDIDFIIGVGTIEEYFYERLRFLYRTVKHSDIKNHLPPSQSLGGMDVSDISVLKKFLLGASI